MSISETVLALLTSAGGGAVVAVAIFRFLGVSWLENKFSKQLEKNKHENAKELAALHAKVDGALSKTVKSQEKEFDVLSELWRLSNIAFGTIHGLMNPMQSYSDVSKMSVDMLKDYLKQYEFLPAKEREIIESSDRMETFKEAVYWLKYSRSNNTLNEYRNFLYLNEIFIEEAVAQEFKWVVDSLSKSLSDCNISKQAGDRSLVRDGYKRLSEDILPRLEAIAPVLREKFFERV